ncbi:Hsp33 family molecular chaperone HslO [Bradyrhizobium sp. 190]|nr:Hsp33 family molecular chaperone HslO [Bradyrhizobium sp. 190]
MLKSFAPKDCADMVKHDKVGVPCEFCSLVYQFTPHEAGPGGVGDRFVGRAKRSVPTTYPRHCC